MLALAVALAVLDEYPDELALDDTLSVLLGDELGDPDELALDDTLSVLLGDELGEPDELALGDTLSVLLGDELGEPDELTLDNTLRVELGEPDELDVAEATTPPVSTQQKVSCVLKVPDP